MIVANEVPDQGSWNQAHTEMEQTTRVEVAGLAPDLARNSRRTYVWLKKDVRMTEQ